ncbi:MAG: hypothetical protein JJE53_02835, partial [Candidatus Pacebacteria bacterium]|nr:hypothetical protein [Candidatus Paceibacterota bacterium]
EGSLNASNFTTTITGVTTATPTTGGVESPGIDNILTSVGDYSVDEGAYAGYAKTLSADCSGTIALGETKTCTITNNDIHQSSGGSSGSGIVYGCKDPTATNYNYFVSSNPSLCTYAMVDPVVVAIPVVTPAVIVHKLPKTGFPPQEPWYMVMYSVFLNLIK